MIESKGRVEIRVTGFGGQGVILMGKILGTAAAIHHHRHATMIQTYGPETRGSACRVDLLLADQPIDYPYLKVPNLLIAMSQDGYNKFRGTLKPGGTLLYDEELVSLNAEDAQLAAGGGEAAEPAKQIKLAAVPAMRLAEQAGGRVMTNMAMLGFCVARTNVVGRPALEATVRKMVPPSTVPANLEAVRLGFEFGRGITIEAYGYGGEGPVDEVTLIP